MLKRLSKKVVTWDSFSKTVEEFRVTTLFGGVISIISVLCITVLFISELIDYVFYDRTTSFEVDIDRLRTMKISVDIDFPAMPCELLGIDLLEISGSTQLSITNHIYKTKLKKRVYETTEEEVAPGRQRGRRRRRYSKKYDSGASLGNKPSKAFHLSSQIMPLPKDYCGSCYGAYADETCCNTCEDVRKAYEHQGWLLDFVDTIEQCIREGIVSFSKSTEELLGDAEGCNVRGYLEVDKLAGNFHIAPGHTFEINGVMLHDMSQVRSTNINMSHYINHFSIGDPYPGRMNPLDGVAKIREQDGVTGIHEYFLKVVPTKYKRPSNFFRSLYRGKQQFEQTYQYSVNEYFHLMKPTEEGQTLPGVYFVYDINPISVVYMDQRPSFIHFIVQLCAIIGGVFTVSGMIDGLFYQSGKVIQKMRMGKAD